MLEFDSQPDEFVVACLDRLGRTVDTASLAGDVIN